MSVWRLFCVDMRLFCVRYAFVLRLLGASFASVERVFCVQWVFVLCLLGVRFVSIGRLFTPLGGREMNRLTRATE